MIPELGQLCLVIALGLAQFFTFPRSEDPAITIREAVVTAHFPGMAPEDYAALVHAEAPQARLDAPHQLGRHCAHRDAEHPGGV